MHVLAENHCVVCQLTLRVAEQLALCVTVSGSFGVLLSAMGGGASLPALDPSAAAGCLGGSHRPYLFPEASKSDAEAEGEGRTKISGVAAGGREYLQTTQEPVPVEREDKSAEDGGRAPCHRIADGGREYLATPLQPHLQIDQDPSNTNAPAPSYELSRPEELVRFLREANVALVRGKFLARLIEENRVLPRRQEAEAEKDAFVTDGELEEWISKQRPVIWTLSHSWESREHADPFGYQICRLKEGFEKTPALGLEMFHSAWFFYDYVCLYQFKRMENHQEDSFRKAMGNMHVLYAHECTRTISIQKAAPPNWIDLEKSIPIYYNHSGKVEPRPIKSLILNDTPYIKRGWTQAELLWSSSRAQMLFIPELNLSISGCTTDAELLDGEASNTAQRAEVPVTPEIFKQRTEELVFTHRVDLDPVIRLQAKVFHYKASSALSLSLQQLTASDVETLSAALPHYVFLQSLAVSHLELNEKAAKSLENALLEVPQLRSISFTDCAKPCPELAMAMAGVLKGRGFLHHLDLTGCCLTTAGMEALAEALKDNSVSLHELVLMDLRESGDGKALAKGVKSNTSVTMLQIYGTSLSLEAIEVVFESQLGSLGFGARYHGAAADGVWRLKDLGTQLTDAVEAVAEGMELTTSLSELDLSYCGLEDPHAQRLAKALKRNQSLRFLDLRSDQPFSEETTRELKDAWNESRPLDHLLL